MKSLQLTFATTIARFAGWLSHALLGKSGETIAGRVLLILCPSAISKLAAGRKIILVSATNGKTSTTRARLASWRLRGASQHPNLARICRVVLQTL